MVNVTGFLGIGEVARRTGLSVHTLRFYEREGLFAGEVRRDSSGRRMYGPDDLEWLAICVRFRSTGMPLPQIRRYAELIRAGDGHEAERLEVLRSHRRRMEGRIAELTECLGMIDYKVKVYEERLAEGTADRLWNPTADDETPPPCEEP